MLWRENFRSCDALTGAVCDISNYLRIGTTRCPNIKKCAGDANHGFKIICLIRLIILHALANVDYAFNKIMTLSFFTRPCRCFFGLDRLVKVLSNLRRKHSSTRSQVEDANVHRRLRGHWKDTDWGKALLGWTRSYILLNRFEKYHIH